MRRTVAAMLISASLAVPVGGLAFDARQLAPSPLGIVLMAGQWLMKDRVEVYYVRVQGTAANESQARDNAFRLAINQAVGSLVVSETTVRDGDLAQHEILNYSSGFIHDFRVLNTGMSGGQVQVDMDVWVSKSLIADRILNISRGQAQVEGGRISAQIQSFKQERATADRVLDTVLTDYPSRAFDISVGKTQVSADEQRRIWLQVPIEIGWNDRYLASLSEALRTVNQKPNCSGWLSACQSQYVVKAPGVTAHFDDEQVFWIFERHTSRSNPHVMMTVLDSSGRPQHRDCFAVPELGYDYSPWKFVEMGGLIQVNHWRRKRTNLLVELTNLPVSNLDRIEVAVVRQAQCPGQRRN
jgi:hypothetical protein